MNYVDIIKKRREENRELLKSMGLFNLRQETDISTPKSPANSARKTSKVSSQCCKTPYFTPSRRSNRLIGKEPPKYADIDDMVRDIKKTYAEKTPNPPRKKIKRDNVFGAIPGVSVGTEFVTRIEASHAGIHRPTVAGIHGNPVLGCYSLALSGGYEDDVDLGDSFIYTGEGGRDLKGTKTNPKNLRTAPQSKDQVLERGNLALSKNVENNVPVRVLRGYKLKSKFAPIEGYRYDGLYKVVEYYLSTGKSGFSVFKFRMERLEDQESAPWADDFEVKECSPQKENMAIEDEELSLGLYRSLK